MLEGTRPPIVFRGSRRRLRQIRLRDNWSAEMSWLAIWIVIILCLIIPGSYETPSIRQSTLLKGLGSRLF